MVVVSPIMDILCKVVRLEQTHEGALGAMLLNDHYFCSTIEPDNGDPERFQIPEGIYYCKPFHGTRFPNTFEIVVPNHTALLFHAGNTEKDTTGCVVVGQYPAKLMGDRAVLNSGVTFEKFMSHLKNKMYFYTLFTNYY